MLRKPVPKSCLKYYFNLLNDNCNRDAIPRLKSPLWTKLINLPDNRCLDVNRITMHLGNILCRYYTVSMTHF